MRFERVTRYWRSSDAIPDRNYRASIPTVAKLQGVGLLARVPLRASERGRELLNDLDCADPASTRQTAERVAYNVSHQ